ncbi:MAG: beta-ketoacyl-[acyl-carrier-protein] synthase family protein [Planctomycetota bacterium]
MTHSVVITGFGVVSALGKGVDEMRSRLRLGESALGPTQTLHHPDLQEIHVGEVPDLVLSEGQSRGSALLLASAEEALEGAGLTGGIEGDVILGTTLGGMDRGLPFMQDVLTRGVEKADVALLRDFHPGCQPKGLKRRLRLQGRTLVLNNACSSGTDALGVAFERIRDGRAKRILAGGYDPLCTFVALGFGSLMNVSRTRCRPFDRDRDGLALGEGAALFVLESEEEAQRRGASPQGFVRGFGAASDAYHLTQPNPNGYAIGAAMEQAIQSAGIGPAEVGYINLHGTGTKTNDLSEYQGLVHTFGEHLPSLACSSTKSTTGHALGAAGAVEAAICLIALQEGFLPPNVGLETPDPTMTGLSLVREPRNQAIRFAMSNSLGFGGGASSILLEGPRNRSGGEGP